MADVRGFIDAIADARFVLAGALLGAIVACAFDIPFSYFNSGYVDVPFKWADFAASIAIENRFATTVEEGFRIHETNIKPVLRKPPLRDLLAVAPLKAPRRLLIAAGKYDARVAAARGDYRLNSKA